MRRVFADIISKSRIYRKLDATCEMLRVSSEHFLISLTQLGRNALIQAKDYSLSQYRTSDHQFDLLIR